MWVERVAQKVNMNIYFYPWVRWFMPIDPCFIPAQVRLYLRVLFVPISQIKMIPSDLLTQSTLSRAVIQFLPLSLGEPLSFFLPPLQGIRLVIGKHLVSIGEPDLVFFFFFFKFANGGTSALQTMTPTCGLPTLVWEICTSRLTKFATCP